MSERYDCETCIKREKCPEAEPGRFCLQWSSIKFKRTNEREESNDE